MKRSAPAKIVYDDLVSMWRPGTTVAELCQLYLSFGPDSFAIPLNQDDPCVEFSGLDLCQGTQRKRCERLLPIDPLRRARLT
jgi:hypothetical protein